MSLLKLKSLKLAVIAAAVGAASLFSAARTDAGTLDLSQFGWFASFDDNVDLTVLSTSNNGVVVRLQKFADFNEPNLDNTTAQPLSIVFRQVSRNAVPQIAIEEETVLNNTGTDWQGFRFILEGGIGANKPTFDTAASADFSTAPFDTKEYLNGDRELRLSGGTLPSGNFPANVWRPGRDDGALVINANPITSGALAQTFVFKEQPILIPLPAAAWTSLSGLVAVGLLVGAKQARRILA